MRHARPLAILTTAALVLGLPLAVWAQAVPEAAAVAPVAADPLLTLLGSLGPTGGAGAIVAYVLHTWRAEAKVRADLDLMHAAEREDLRKRVSALELTLARQEGQTMAVHKILNDFAARLGDR
jgi:hypothetical protein